MKGKVTSESFRLAAIKIGIRLITPLRMSYEVSFAKAFPFDKMIAGMREPEMIKDTAKIVNEAIKEKVQVDLIINNRAGGNAPMIAQEVAKKFSAMQGEDSGSG